MSALKARVENGRLTLNEPTDLPEGQVIELIPLDEVISTEGDDLDDTERAARRKLSFVGESFFGFVWQRQPE